MTIASKSGEKSRRLRERVGLKLPVSVYGRDSVDYEWTEMSRLLDVTPFGARFTLKRPTEVGRLLQLRLAMPRQLRCFDHVEDQYRVWSLVRNLKFVDPKQTGGALLEVGVAFIGKRPPKSFENNPAQRFDIEKAKEGTLWTVMEESSEALIEVSESDKRKETRHIIPIEVLVELFNEEGELSMSEYTVTENISTKGAAIFTSLNISAGRFVKLTSDRYGHSVLAVVRSRSARLDNIARLHVEFVGSEWPL